MLADEINRTPPKTQAALLEAMQEHQVTVGGSGTGCAEPFFVLATQNPIEQEGTYPLPEAQLDRFMFNIYVDYPERGGGVRDRQADDGRRTADGRRRRCRRRDPGDAGHRAPGAGGRSRDPLRAEVHPAHAAARARATVPEFIQRLRDLGRRAAGQPIPGAGRQGPGRAARPATTSSCEDIRAVAMPVLRHRIITNFNAEAEGIKPDEIVQRLIEHIPYADDRGKRSWTTTRNI